MALKGTLATFSVAKLQDVTVDERRSVRGFLKGQLKDISNPSLEILQQAFEDCMISDEELLTAERGLGMHPELVRAMDEIIADMNADGKNYESINVQRLKAIIDELPEPMTHNLEEMRKLVSLQHAVPVAIKEILDAACAAKSSAELSKATEQGFELMCTIANNPEADLKPDMRINEAHTSHVKDMTERFKTGYVYHWSIEDELKKASFAVIFARLNPAQQSQYDKMAALLDEMNKSVDTAYRMNWRQIALIRRVYSLLHECLSKYFE